MISVHVETLCACFVTWLKHVLIAFGTLGSFSFVISFAYFAELSTAKTRINLQILTQDTGVLVLNFELEPTCHTVVL